jgi:hypothetical protein
VLHMARAGGTGTAARGPVDEGWSEGVAVFLLTLHVLAAAAAAAAVLPPPPSCRQQLSGILHFLQVHADQAGLSVIVTQAEINEALAPRKQDLPAIAAAVAATRAAKASGSTAAAGGW